MLLFVFRFVLPLLLLGASLTRFAIPSLVYVIAFIAALLLYPHPALPLRGPFLPFPSLPPSIRLLFFPPHIN